MAKTGQERSAIAALKRVEYDEKELRHRCRVGMRQKLEALMAWNCIEEMSEAIQNLILNAHALGSTLSYQAIQSPHHKVLISENVARMFRSESLAVLKRDPGDDVIDPKGELTGYPHTHIDIENQEYPICKYDYRTEPDKQVYPFATHSLQRKPIP